MPKETIALGEMKALQEVHSVLNFGTIEECKTLILDGNCKCCTFDPVLGNWIGLLPHEANYFRYSDKDLTNWEFSEDGKKLDCSRGGPNCKSKPLDCLTGDTLIPTTSGLRTIKDIVENKLEAHVPTSMSGEAKILNWFERGSKPVYELIDNYGYKIRATDNHKFQVLDLATGDLVWKELKNIKEGDYLPKRVRIGCESSHTLSLDAILSDAHKLMLRSSSAYNIPLKPTVMTPELAYVMGLIIADGSNSEDGIQFSHSDAGLVYHLSIRLKYIFSGLTANVLKDKKGKVYYLCITSKTLATWFKELGMSLEGARNKVIPWSILQANSRCQKAFLAGFMDGNISITSKAAVISSASKRLIQDLHILLANYGVIGAYGYTESRRATRKGKKAYEQLAHIRVNALGFNNLIKILREYSLYSSSYKEYNFIHKPYTGIPVDLITAIFSPRKVKRGTWKNDEGTEVSYNHLRQFYDGGSVYIQYSRLERLEAYKELGLVSQKLKDRIEYYKENDVVFSQVSSIEPCGNEQVYDITVDKEHCFTANSFSVHNCKMYPYFPYEVKETKENYIVRVIVGFPKCRLGESETFQAKRYTYGSHLFRVAQCAIILHHANWMKQLAEAASSFKGYDMTDEIHIPKLYLGGV